ncbi:MAG: HelD family protein, partial [Actinopolymorphaceae bacterium]
MGVHSRHAISSERAEIEHEQRYVDAVYDRLAVMVARATEVGRDGRDRGMLDYTGEIKEEDYRSLFERDVLVDHAVRRLAALDAQREGLVFGRLDHRAGEVRYVGRIGVRDAEHEPLVIDWRAPAAAVFYQATAADPKDVVRRRILRCQGQRVVGVEDDLLDPDAAPADLQVVGDGALMAALTAARGRQMRDIVATIQREQDEIIRAPSRGLTLISGGPGTGKTVVALHRAAYLLYTERRRIAGGGVLVVGPSPVFMSYIERVLPTLGEHEATLRSMGEIVDGIVATRTDPFDVAVVKGSLRMRRILGRAARGPAPGAPEELRLYVGGRVLRLDAADLTEVRRTVLQRGGRRNRARGEAVRGLLAA